MYINITPYTATIISETGIYQWWIKSTWGQVSSCLCNHSIQQFTSHIQGFEQLLLFFYFSNPMYEMLHFSLKQYFHVYVRVMKKYRTFCLYFPIIFHQTISMGVFRNPLTYNQGILVSFSWRIELGLDHVLLISVCPVSDT